MLHPRHPSLGRAWSGQPVGRWREGPRPRPGHGKDTYWIRRHFPRRRPGQPGTRGARHYGGAQPRRGGLPARRLAAASPSPRHPRQRATQTPCYLRPAEVGLETETETEAEAEGAGEADSAWRRRAERGCWEVRLSCAACAHGRRLGWPRHGTRDRPCGSRASPRGYSPAAAALRPAAAAAPVRRRVPEPGDPASLRHSCGRSRAGSPAEAGPSPYQSRLGDHPVGRHRCLPLALPQAGPHPRLPRRPPLPHPLRLLRPPPHAWRRRRLAVAAGARRAGARSGWRWRHSGAGGAAAAAASAGAGSSPRIASAGRDLAAGPQAGAASDTSGGGGEVVGAGGLAVAAAAAAVAEVEAAAGWEAEAHALLLDEGRFRSLVARHVAALAPHKRPAYLGNHAMAWQWLWCHMDNFRPCECTCAPRGMV
jgi:hypothetical protein